jgi:protein-disulfide isomerase
MTRLKSLLDLVSTALVILAAGALLYTTFMRTPETARAAQGPPPPQSVTETLSAEAVRHSLGTGTVAIVEFSDFQCPYCARHAQEVFPHIKKALIDTGKTRYVAMHLPLPMHANALAIAIASECAGGKFWDVREGLFSAPAAPYVDGALASCTNDPATKALVEGDMKEATRLKVTGTPSFFVGKVRADGGIELRRRFGGGSAFSVFEAEVAKLKG